MKQPLFVIVQVTNDTVSLPDSTAAANACHTNTAEAPPSEVAVPRAKETEGNEAEEEDEENNGEVPNDVKPEESNIQDGAVLPTERTQQKPPYSYAQLIVQALLAARDRRQTLSSIYSFIADMYPYYKLGEKGWKVCSCGWDQEILRVK